MRDLETEGPRRNDQGEMIKENKRQKDWRELGENWRELKTD